MPNSELSESSPDRINRLDCHMAPRDLKQSERLSGYKLLTAGELLDSNRALHPSLSQGQAFKERSLEGNQKRDR